MSFGTNKGLQIIDYKTNDPVTGLLAQKFAKEPVKAIFDCVGSDDLFRKCAGYLSKDGIFITIVGGVGAVPIVRSKLLPVALGGVPRRYKLLALWPDGAIAKEVVKWIEDGHYHTYPVDSEYSMDKVVEVSFKGRFFVLYIADSVGRGMKEWQVRGLGGRWLLI